MFARLRSLASSCLALWQNLCKSKKRCGCVQAANITSNPHANCPQARSVERQSPIEWVRLLEYIDMALSPHLLTGNTYLTAMLQAMLLLALKRRCKCIISVRITNAGATACNKEWLACQSGWANGSCCSKAWLTLNQTVSHVNAHLKRTRVNGYGWINCERLVICNVHLQASKLILLTLSTQF